MSYESDVLTARLVRSFVRVGNQYGKAMLLPLLKNLSGKSYTLSFRNNPVLLVNALDIFPELAHRDEVWTQPVSVQDKVLRSLLMKSKGKDWWEHTVEAMLNSSSSIGSTEISKRFGNVFAPLVLDRYAEGKKLSNPWLNQATQPRVIAKWIEDHREDELVRLERVLALSDPDENSFRNLSTSLWLHLVEKAKADKNLKSFVSYSFVLCLAFWNPKGKADDLFLESLSPVYRGMKDGKLNAPVKIWLRKKLSPRPLFYMGDYPESIALVRAVCRSLIYHGFPASPFINKLNNTELRELVKLQDFDGTIKKWLEDS